jgi:hypothetical protein
MRHDTHSKVQASQKMRHKNASQKCVTKMRHKKASQKGVTKMRHKNASQFNETICLPHAVVLQKVTGATLQCRNQKCRLSKCRKNFFGHIMNP